MIHRHWSYFLLFFSRLIFQTYTYNQLSECVCVYTVLMSHCGCDSSDTTWRTPGTRAKQSTFESDN